MGKLTEMNLTARQSRLSLLVDAKIGTTKVSGYYEADFLGAGTTSNNRQSNSYVFRQRQLWARADFADGWAFSAGQMWSLATENTKGIANRAEWFPSQIDPQYVVGYNWQRAYGARIAKSFGDKVTLAASAEGSQATVGGRGFSTYTNTPVTGTATTYQNFFEFAPGSGGGLYNAFDGTGYSPNKTPDFIIKAAFDPGFGHYEVFGILSNYQNRVYPCAVIGTTAGQFPDANDTNSVVLYRERVANTEFSGSAERVGNWRCDWGQLRVCRIAEKKFRRWFEGDVRRRHRTVCFSAACGCDLPSRWHHDANPRRLLARFSGLACHQKFDVYAYVGGEYAARTAYHGLPVREGYGNTRDSRMRCSWPSSVPRWRNSADPIRPVTRRAFARRASADTVRRTPTTPDARSRRSERNRELRGGGGSCAGDTRYIGEGDHRLLAQDLPGREGQSTVGYPILLLLPNGWSGSNWSDGASTSGVVATRGGQHGVDLVPLLFAIKNKNVRDEGRLFGAAPFHARRRMQVHDAGGVRELS